MNVLNNNELYELERDYYGPESWNIYPYEYNDQAEEIYFKSIDKFINKYYNEKYISIHNLKKSKAAGKVKPARLNRYDKRSL